MRSYGVSLVLIAACGSSTGRAGPDAGPGSGPDAGVDASPPITCSASTVVSFRTDVAPLINHCSGELCHSLITNPGPTWPRAALVNVATTGCSDGRVLVKPGDPTSSYLIQKLAGVDMCSGGRMPKLGTYLSDANMKKIEDWICQGAADN